MSIFNCREFWFIKQVYSCIDSLKDRRLQRRNLNINVEFFKMRKAPVLYSLFALLAAMFNFTAFGQTTSLVSIDGTGHMTYTPDAKGNVLPDFSYVGYHHGEKPIPDVPVATTISPIAGDNRQHIQDAINAVSILAADANGHKGAVLLDAGVYEVSGTIYMRSGVVLRGMGDSTIIRAVFTSQDPLISANSSGNSGYSILGDTRKKITDDYVPFGARTFTIESGHTFNAGDRVVLRRQPTQAWIDELDVAQYGWTTGSYTIDFLRVVEAVEGNSITIDAPVVDHIYDGIANGYLYKYENTVDFQSEIGIEDLRLETTYSDESDRDHSHTAIQVNGAENGWIRNIDAYHFTYSTVSFGSGSYKWTVDNCRYLRPVGTLNSGTRYSFGLGSDAHQILIQNCFSDFGRHDFVTGSRTPGPSVFSNCIGMNCWNVSGPHHRWCTGILYDRVSTDLDINVENRTDSGSGHGWAGANHVMWNCSTYSRMVIHDPPTDANNWAIGCIAGEGVTGVGRRATEPLGLVESEGTFIADIPSLYRAQLEDRLGAGTASTDQPFPGFQKDQETHPDELTISSAVAGNEAEHHGIIRVAEDSYDGDVQTRWASETSIPEAWIEYTLDGTYEIYQIKLQLFNSWIRTYPIKIEVDGNTVFSGTSQNTEEFGWNYFSFTPIAGNKVKISMTANNSFGGTDLCMHETKIYGSSESLPTYQLIVDSGSGAGSYVDGSNVAIAADAAPDGKAFDQWTGDTAAIDDIYSVSTVVTMPDSNIHVSATYHSFYNVTVNSGTGDGVFEPRTEVVITADEAPAGKIFDQWTGNIEVIKDIYTPYAKLTMPAYDVQVAPVYKDPVNLAASADAYVRGADYAEINYGSEPILEIKTLTDNLAEQREVFIKFDVSSMPEKVSMALLKIYVHTNTGGTRHGCSFVADDSWTETGINFNNKPNVGALLDTRGVPTAGSWIEFDVTNQVKNEILGDGSVSFQVSDERENVFVTYDAKEGANAPVLSYGSPGGSTTFILTATAGSNGSISPGGTYLVTEGSDQTFEIVPDLGYEIGDVLVDGSSVGAVSSYTFTDITEDHTLSATFEEIVTYTINATSGSNGTISPSGDIEVIQGLDQTFTITPDPNCVIVDVLVDGSSVGAVSSYTFTNVTGEHTISASFELVTNTITATAGSNGSISPAGNVEVIEGENQTFFITADPGYVIATVMVDGASVGAVSRYTFSYVTTGHTISVIFAPITHTITANAGSNGSITPDGELTVNEGTDQTFTIAADPSYMIEDVRVDGASVGALSTYTFTNIKADHVISASFVPDSSDVAVPPAGMTQTDGAIKIFPNPAHGHIYIDGIDGEAHVRIYDILGKTLMSKNVDSRDALKIAQLKPGMYMIEVQQQNRHVIERLIIE